MPQNLEKLYELLHSRNEKEKELPQNMAKALDFSMKSFQIHRPIGKVMIVLMGQSGTGKSAAINNLFDDKLCQTHEEKSETHKVTECRKLIAFSDLKLKAYLSLVDTPGAFDTLKEHDKNNMTIIQEFRSKHSAFWTGTDHIVYPNLVLITVNAGETRLAETDSFFSQTLRMIQETTLLDMNRVNLIVAATFAANISTKPNYFAEEKARIRSVIAKVVFNILGILNVEIVFVENRPDKHQLRKRENCDFYELPDGEMTPLNLFRAICRQFKSNEDFFGSLITSKYFNEDCQEKKDKVIPKVLHTYEEPDRKLNEVLSKAFQKYIDFRQVRCGEGNVSSYSDLQFVGYGYSLIDECTKSCVRLNSVFPGFESFASQDKRIRKMIFANIEEYKKHRLEVYGLDATTKLNFSHDVNSNGKWRKKGDLDHYISFVFVERMGTLIVSEGIHKNWLVSELRDDLDALPYRQSIFDRIFALYRTFRTNAPQESDKFRSFFDKWGTHYIKEVGIGGSIQVDCCIPSSWKNGRKNDLEERIESKIASLVNQHEFEDFNGIVCDNHVFIKFHGGVHPKATKLLEVTPVMFAEWKRSLKNHQVELENTIKLDSYEVLLDDEYKKTSFKKAAFEYWEGCPNNLTAKRREESEAEELSSMTGLATILGTFVIAAMAIV